MTRFMVTVNIISNHGNRGICNGKPILDNSKYAKAHKHRQKRDLKHGMSHEISF